jgi:UrcA family protein
MHKFIVSLAAAAALLGAGPALATDPSTRIVKISHADLDLSTVRGREALDRRIAAATENVCGSYAGASVEEQDAISHCRVKVQHQIAAQRTQNSVALR